VAKDESDTGYSLLERVNGGQEGTRCFVTNPHLVRTQRWTRASAPPAELRGCALLLA